MKKESLKSFIAAAIFSGMAVGISSFTSVTWAQETSAAQENPNLTPTKISCSTDLSIKQQDDSDKNLPKAEITGQIEDFEKDPNNQTLAFGTLNILVKVSNDDFKDLGIFSFKAIPVIDQGKVSSYLMISENTHQTSRIFHGVLNVGPDATLSTLSVMIDDRILDFSTNCEEILTPSTIAKAP